MKTQRNTRRLIVPAVFMGCAPGLVAMAVLFNVGMPLGLAAVFGLSAGIGGALALLKTI